MKKWLYFTLGFWLVFGLTARSYASADCYWDWIEDTTTDGVTVGLRVCPDSEQFDVDKTTGAPKIDAEYQEGARFVVDDDIYYDVATDTYYNTHVAIDKDFADNIEESPDYPNIYPHLDFDVIDYDPCFAYTVQANPREMDDVYRYHSNYPWGVRTHNEESPYTYFLPGTRGTSSYSIRYRVERWTGEQWLTTTNVSGTSSFYVSSLPTHDYISYDFALRTSADSANTYDPNGTLCTDREFDAATTADNLDYAGINSAGVLNDEIHDYLKEFSDLLDQLTTANQGHIDALKTVVPESDWPPAWTDGTTDTGGDGTGDDGTGDHGTGDDGTGDDGTGDDGTGDDGTGDDGTGDDFGLGPETGPIEGWTGRDIDFSPINDLLTHAQTRYPFSLPGQFAGVFSYMQVDPVAPAFTIPLPFAAHDYVMSMDSLDNIAMLWRGALAFFFHLLVINAIIKWWMK